MTTKDVIWEKIGQDINIRNHNFEKEPLQITAEQIKQSTQNLKVKEPRILCKHDSRESRPKIFQDLGLFILPIKNGVYVIVKGEGYVDIPEITSEPEIHQSILDFVLETSKVGNSEMQHLDFAYASSIIRTFTNDPSLVLTIRGRKRTPEISFKVSHYELITKGVQTEVDAGYEGKDSIVLVEAKNSKTNNEIIRQLYYPYRKWEEETTKKATTLFFEKRGSYFNLWQFDFSDKYNYNSIKFTKSSRFKIQ